MYVKEVLPGERVIRIYIGCSINWRVILVEATWIINHTTLQIKPRIYWLCPSLQPRKWLPPYYILGYDNSPLNFDLRYNDFLSLWPRIYITIPPPYSSKGGSQWIHKDKDSPLHWGARLWWPFSDYSLVTFWTSSLLTQPGPNHFLSCMVACEFVVQPFFLFMASVAFSTDIPHERRWEMPPVKCRMKH